jgi:SAM-dependent methyltransferase
MTLNPLLLPQDLIDRHTIDEHVAFADAYFEGRDDHAYLYQKPFYHPQDCVTSVINLGQLLAGLRLESGMQVLDFAAGSCWLSRILLQLGCQVISADASAKALEIGRRLLERYPPIMSSNAQPVFLPFDGERIDLPDNSVDRIVVNDAFHHIPNTPKVLAEFCRVLKPEGIVGMSEPGRHHSKSEASQYEMRQFNVIENDFVLESIWDQAQEVGFVDIQICPVLRHPYLNMAQYLSCIEGNVPPKLNTAIAQDTTNHSIFFLGKTPFKEKTTVAPQASDHQDFDEAYYLWRYPDVAAAVAKGQFQSGWHHYELYGQAEGRSTLNK